MGKGFVWKRRGSRKEAQGMGRWRQLVQEGCKAKGHSVQKRKACDRTWLVGWLHGGRGHIPSLEGVNAHLVLGC